MPADYAGTGDGRATRRAPISSATWTSNLWDEPSAAALRAELTQRSFDATVAACDPGPTQIGRF